jgi:hypothetical protein
MREPLSWSLSGFHMMCVTQGACLQRKHGIRQKANATSLHDLERLVQPNPQCGFFYARGFPYNFKRAQIHPTDEQCEEVWQAMRTNMDWIGLVEEYKTTFDLLKRLTGLELLMISSNVANKTEDRLRMKDIVNTTAETRLLGVNELDIQLYRRVQEYFTRDMWDEAFD